MNGFNEKVAIVTGAGQGIGLEICRQLIKAGAYVIFNDQDVNLAEQAAHQLGSNSIAIAGDCRHVTLLQRSPTYFVAGDCSEENIIDQMIRTAIDQFNHLDIVIANAGITLYGPFLSYTREAFDRVMAVNLAGSFFLAQQAALVMKKTARDGSILLMSSVTGHQAHKNLTAYGMSKAALEMLAKGLVVELSEYGITVNAIAPGATATERTLEDADYEKTWSRITPLGRPATVSEIAGTALFLVSGSARHITGQTLVVDGGWTSVSPSPYASEDE